MIVTIINVVSLEKMALYLSNMNQTIQVVFAEILGRVLKLISSTLATIAQVVFLLLFFFLFKQNKYKAQKSAKVGVY